MFIKPRNQNIDRQIEYLHTKAVAHHKEKKLKEALGFYSQSTELDENQPAWIYGNAITIAAQIGDYDAGVKLKLKAEKVHPESSEVDRAIALLFQKLNNLNKAVEYYLKSVDLQPQQPEWVYTKLLDLLIELELFDRAVEIREKGIEQFPESVNINRHRELLEIVTATPNSSNLSPTESSIYTDEEKEIILAPQESRETPASIENFVDLDINTLRRQLMDSAILERYETLLDLALCNIEGGQKIMDVDALVHCLAEIKTDIHYLKTQLAEPPAAAVDPQAKQDINLEKIISLNQPVPVKCELKNRIVGSGWHAAEEHGRWSGPGTLSSVVLPRPAVGSYRFEMIVKSEAKLELLKTLKININDRPLDFAIATTNQTNSFPAVINGNIVISPEDNDSFLAVDLIIAETVNPQAGDARLIGLLVEKICLIPSIDPVI